MTTRSANLWCPSCGTEYRPGSRYCSQCRVALVHAASADKDEEHGTDAPDAAKNDEPTDLVDVG